MRKIRVMLRVAQMFLKIAEHKKCMTDDKLN